MREGDRTIMNLYRGVTYIRKSRLLQLKDKLDTQEKKDDKAKHRGLR